eukprot:GHVS01104101.1.p2 GENE.GHVS01104101.1~~GHVS01104101.1.p2  ORF type:complete len:103 (+),score=7.90 GHVS01104101.1:1077-1385(+)
MTHLLLRRATSVWSALTMTAFLMTCSAYIATAVLNALAARFKAYLDVWQPGHLHRVQRPSSFRLLCCSQKCHTNKREGSDGINQHSRQDITELIGRPPHDAI